MLSHISSVEEASQLINKAVTAGILFNTVVLSRKTMGVKIFPKVDYGNILIDVTTKTIRYKEEN